MTLFSFRVRNWSSGKPMSVWNCKIMPNTDLYREKKGDLCKTHCEEQIKNKNQGTKKKSCFLGLPGEKRPILSQRFTLHPPWSHSRKIASGFSWHNAWRSQAWTSLGPSLHGALGSYVHAGQTAHTHIVFTHWDNDRTDLSLSQSWGGNMKIDFPFIPNNRPPGLVKNLIIY